MRSLVAGIGRQLDGSIASLTAIQGAPDRFSVWQKGALRSSTLPLISPRKHQPTRRVRQVRRVYWPFPYLTPSYIIWMAQSMIAVYKAMSPDDRQRVYDWVSSHGAAALFDLEKPNMRREGEKRAVRAD